jgi:hypothetical protein
VVPKLSGLLPAIEAQVSRHPDATIAELRAWLLETHKVSASTGLINKTLAALDLTFKTYGPPRLQDESEDGSDRSAQTYPVSRASLAAKMEIRAPWSSQKSRRQSAVF